MLVECSEKKVTRSNSVSATNFRRPQDRGGKGMKTNNEINKRFRHGLCSYKVRILLLTKEKGKKRNASVSVATEYASSSSSQKKKKCVSRAFVRARVHFGTTSRVIL